MFVCHLVVDKAQEERLRASTSNRYLPDSAQTLSTPLLPLQPPALGSTTALLPSTFQGPAHMSVNFADSELCITIPAPCDSNPGHYITSWATNNRALQYTLRRSHRAFPEPLKSLTSNFPSPVESASESEVFEVSFPFEADLSVFTGMLFWVYIVVTLWVVTPWVPVFARYVAFCCCFMWELAFKCEEGGRDWTTLSKSYSFHLRVF